MPEAFRHQPAPNNASSGKQLLSLWPITVFQITLSATHMRFLSLFILLAETSSLGQASKIPATGNGGSATTLQAQAPVIYLIALVNAARLLSRPYATCAGRTDSPPVTGEVPAKHTPESRRTTKQNVLLTGRHCAGQNGASRKRFQEGL